jgi:hypothetical protein
LQIGHAFFIILWTDFLLNLIYFGITIKLSIQFCQEVCHILYIFTETSLDFLQKGI